MAYSLTEARELVVRAGKMLVAEGLTARTWGNISARISDTQFVITPSGLDYEGLTPEKIVTVNIADLSHEGSIKPSSEKGIHADAYKLRPQSNFVIHTHQKLASAISVGGSPLETAEPEDRALLGDTVPCAAYGIPSTGFLRRAVARELELCPQSSALLLKNHGTLCLGYSFENAFAVARALERAAEGSFFQAVPSEKLKPREIPDLGTSCRAGGGFWLKLGGESVMYLLEGLPEGAPDIARLHARIYMSTKAGCILHCREPEAAAISEDTQVLRPFLDDQAQIAGISQKCLDCTPAQAQKICRALRGRNAVFLKGMGALCTGISEDEAQSVGMVLTKACAAALYAESLRGRCYLNALDARLQRLVYVMKYSKQR